MRLTVCVIVAIIIHGFILLYKPPLAPAVLPAAMPLGIKEVERQTELSLNPPLDPVVKTEEDEMPARLTSVESEDIPERNVAVVPASTEHNKVKAAPISPAALPMEVQEKPPVLAEKTPPQENAVNDYDTEDLTEVVKKLSDENKSTVKSDMTSREYANYLRSLEIGRVKGQHAPQLIHAFHSATEIIDVHRYYGMKILALDPDNPRAVVEVLGLGSNDLGFQEIDGFNWNRYSNRVYQRTAPYFEKIRKRVVSGYSMSSDAKLYSVSPNSVDTYFRYKQIQAIRSSGYNENEIANVVARFHETDFSGWIMAVERLQLNDGKIVAVSDFELAKLR